MSLLNEAYRLKYAGGNESANEAKKRKALAHLDEMIQPVVYRAERAHQAKRAKAEAEFRENPHWKAGWNRKGRWKRKRNRVIEYIHSGWIEKWKKIREGTYQDEERCIWSVHAREQWLEDRGLAPLSEEETPSLDTLVRRHVDETVGKEAVVPLTTALLASIRDACQ